MNKTYTVITPRDKGGCRFETLSREALQARLNEQYYGNIEWVDKFPGDDPIYWGNVGVILRSPDFIVPKAVEVVTQYDI